MKKSQISINQDYITLGQLLKLADIIQSGGMAKWYLSEHVVFVNQDEESRRGRKIYPGDVVSLPDEELLIAIEVNED